MATLTVNGWILNLIFTPHSSVPLLSVGPCLYLTLCPSPLLTTPFILMAFSYSQILCSYCLLTTWKCLPLLNLLLRAGWNCLPPAPDTMHFGCTYRLNPSHLCLNFRLGCDYSQKKEGKKERRRQKIDNLPILVTCRSGTSSMLSNKVTVPLLMEALNSLGIIRPGSIILLCYGEIIVICHRFVEVTLQLQYEVAMLCTCFCDATNKVNNCLESTEDR